MTPSVKRRYIWRAAQLRERLTNKSIARRLGVSEKHVQNVLCDMRKAAR